MLEGCELKDSLGYIVKFYYKMIYIYVYFKDYIYKKMFNILYIIRKCRLK